MTERFKALVIDNNREFTVKVQNLSLNNLPDEDVLIKVSYSSINYKDGLASIPDGKIVKSYPHIPGIDLAGVVVSSRDPRFKKGDEVVATSYEIGVSHFGGYSEFARISGDWIVPLPKGMTLKEAMIFGTAGFTAALSIQKLEHNNIRPESGKILVTGATGGVGSFAVSMLSKLGYYVVASTGKETEKAYLSKLGAKDIISREDVFNGKIKPLDKQLWAGAIDPVGGEPLASVLSKIQYGGSVAVSGLTGGMNLPTSVHPFILRGVNLLGVDSVYCPMEKRLGIWDRLATDLKPVNLLDFVQGKVSLEELPSMLPEILKSKVRGRIVVEI